MQLNTFSVQLENILRSVGGFAGILPQLSNNPTVPQRDKALRVWQRGVENSHAPVVRKNLGGGIPKHPLIPSFQLR